MSPQLHKVCCDHTEIGSCFLLQGHSLSIGELQVRWKYVILIMLGILGTHVLVEQKTDIIVWSHSLTQSSHNSCNCVIGQCFTCRAVLSKVSWKHIMESYCDHNSLMERCLSRSWVRLIELTPTWQSYHLCLIETFGSEIFGQLGDIEKRSG